LRSVTSPTNDSERLLYRNLFDNLIRLDCQGTIRPGLAESWSTESDGRAWVLTLRDGAVFGHGGPVSASEVARGPGFIDSANARALGMDSAFALDERRLRVLMRGGIGDSSLQFLADPSLALIEGMASDSGSGEKSLTMPPRGSLPAIDFRFPLERDPRDALDQEVDLVVTRDPALVDYVSNRADFATFALPWSRTYVLLEARGHGELAGALNTPSVRSSLAKDAVRASARTSEPPYWWSEHAACRTAPMLHSGAVSSRIVYRKNDEVARGLTERIVALASATAGLRAVGLDTAEFAAALRNGSSRGYVIALPRQSLAPCRDASLLPAEGQLLPLIDTRAYAIARKGTPPLTVEWDGTIRVVEP
jgi:hypothetical protein